MTKVVIGGAGGRMGKLLVRGVSAEKDMELVGAIEKKGHPQLGQDAGEMAGLKRCGVVVGSELEGVNSDWDILVEFSTPEATLKHLPVAAEKGKGVVIGTTGFSDEEKRKIKKFSSRIPALLSPNMSVGVNLLFKIAGQVAKVLGTEYDAEIVETHHRLKKDAPSGTALRLAESISEARGQDIPTTPPPSRGRSKEGVVVYGRQGMTGERPKGEIGVHAVRGGTVTGDHTVIFAGSSERIELSHRAESREVFARGAIKAIRFVAEAAPGLYGMQDVIEK